MSVVVRCTIGLAVVVVVGTAPIAGFGQLPPPKPKPASPQSSRPALPTPRAAGSLLVEVDADCSVSVDGKPIGALDAGQLKTVALGLGKHIVRAISAEGNIEWQTVVEIKSSAQEIVSVRLKEQVSEYLRNQARRKESNISDAGAGLKHEQKPGHDDRDAAVGGAAPPVGPAGSITPAGPAAMRISDQVSFETPPERIPKSHAAADDINRLTAWTYKLAGGLSSPSLAAADRALLLRDLGELRDRVGEYLTRVREGRPPTAEEYAQLRAELQRLDARIAPGKIP